MTGAAPEKRRGRKNFYRSLQIQKNISRRSPPPFFFFLNRYPQSHFPRLVFVNFLCLGRFPAPFFFLSQKSKLKLVGKKMGAEIGETLVAIFSFSVGKFFNFFFLMNFTFQSNKKFNYNLKT